ncbi:carboxylate--amine ligase, partial [Nocardioides sp. NPDC000441]
VPVAVLRLAMWQAGRHGITGDLIDPRCHRPRPAREVVELLLEHIGPALRDTGDLARAEKGIGRIFTGGTGSTTQRRIHDEEGRLDRAVVRLAELT